MNSDCPDWISTVNLDSQCLSIKVVLQIVCELVQESQGHHICYSETFETDLKDKSGITINFAHCNMILTMKNYAW